MADEVAEQGEPAGADLATVTPEKLLTLILNQAQDTMAYLTSSDLDSLAGLNESGFKAVVIGAINNVLRLQHSIGWQLASETSVVKPDGTQGFVDLLLTVPGRFTLCLELKYVFCNWDRTLTPVDMYKSHSSLRTSRN
jgi:hypothetical protein